jgi:hypothetical protein
MVNSTAEISNLIIKKKTYQEIVFYLDFNNKLELEKMIGTLLSISYLT